MMIRAYSESYINDAMEVLGETFDYMINDLKYSPDDAFSLFVKSGIASSFENGNPKYVAGKSGAEIAMDIVYKTKGSSIEIEIRPKKKRSREYWMGWIFAYYQWYRAKRFKDLYNGGVTPELVLDKYNTLHEADESKFIKMADTILSKNKRSNLKELRKSRNITQRELAKLSGVSLRMIQLYEQGQQDISKAETKSILSLAKVLKCEVEDLIV